MSRYWSVKLYCYLIFQVPRGHVWLEGDNRSNSADSRIYGPVPQGLICARALCRVWPPKEIKMLTHKERQVIAR